MLKVNELFSGIGAQSAALKRLGIDFEVVATADTDKDALVSYAALHCKAPTEYEYPAATYMADYLAERNIGYDFEKNKPYDWHRLISKKTGKASERLKKYYLSCIISKNRGDVSKIEKLEYADFWTYSFPCQDISVAGKQAGIGKHTRSGLLYEVERLLNVSAEHGELPKYLMLENVKNLVGKKFKQQFEDWLEFLEQLGYNNYWQVLNAKNYGIPQNRERVFAISIRKDVDTGDFGFPEGFDNGLRLKDFLEDEVDEKFYISQEKTEKLISQIKLNNPSIKREPGKADGVYTNQSLSFTRPPLKDLSRTLKANVHDAAVVMPIDKSYNNPKPIEYANCITAREDRGISNHQAEGTAVCIPCITPDREEKRQNGRRFKESEGVGVLQQALLEIQKIWGSLNDETKSDLQSMWRTCERKTIMWQALSRVETEGAFRIRKLTPRTCWRLMGFTDEEFQKAQDAGVSNSQLYKQAGNSIVVDVLEYIFKNLLK